MIYAGTDDCGIYLNDSAEEPRLTRFHLSVEQAAILASQLARLVALNSPPPPKGGPTYRLNAPAGETS